MKYLGPPQSGSQAATTASRNTYGQYYRARVGRGGTPSFSVASAIAAWQGLTDAQRLAWYSYADQLSRHDSLGQVVTITGQDAFVAQSVVSARMALTPLVDAPVFDTFGVVVAYSPTIVAPGVVLWQIDVDGPDGYLEVQQTAASSGTFTSASRPSTFRPPGRGMWWRITTYSGLLAPPVVALGQALGYDSFLSGWKGFYRFRWVSDASRRLGPWTLAGPVIL